jgi:hypothetical protein
MKNQKKTLEEKVREADVNISIKKGTQDFLFLWQDQAEIIRELEKVLKEKFDITGKPKAISLACRFLLREIEAELGKQESNGKEI